MSETVSTFNPGRPAAMDAAYEVLLRLNGPIGDVPYPACLRPIAEAVVDVVGPILVGKMQADRDAWAALATDLMTAVERQRGLLEQEGCAGCGNGMGMCSDCEAEARA